MMRTTVVAPTEQLEPAGSGPAPELQTQLVLTSRFANIELAERALVDLCAEAGLDTDDGYWLVTALREALANAILHGNKQDPERTVRVEYVICADEVVIRIDDEGDGFDPASVPDPTDPGYLLRPSGRGIFYMRQFMSRVEFARAPGGGTRVEMARRVESETRSAPDEE
jgi:serine/threonine-protein kinase RsbW